MRHVGVDGAPRTSAAGHGRCTSDPGPAFRRRSIYTLFPAVQDGVDDAGLGSASATVDRGLTFFGAPLNTYRRMRRAMGASCGMGNARPALRPGLLLPASRPVLCARRRSGALPRTSVQARRPSQARRARVRHRGRRKGKVESFTVIYGARRGRARRGDAAHRQRRAQRWARSAIDARRLAHLRNMTTRRWLGRGYRHADEGADGGGVARVPTGAGVALLRRAGTHG